MHVRQGQVYWCDFGPSFGSSPARVHPCVVVQSDLFNRSRIATTVICLITSNLSRADSPGNVLLRKGDANLPKASVINVSQLLTIDKSELTEMIGSLPPATIRLICSGLHLLFEQIEG
jgi:mRNA interferase MazF